MKSLIKYFIVGLLSIPTFALATPVSWDFTANVLRPLSSMWTREVKVPYITATSTTQVNTFPLFTGTYGTSTTFSATNASSTNASTTNISIHRNFTFAGITGSLWTDFCTSITGGSGLCDGNDATGGAGGGSISTSSIPVAGNLTYWTSPSTVSDVATGTLTETVEGVEFSATRALVGGSSILSLTTGYTIPSTTRMSTLDAFTATPSTVITAGDALTWSGNTLNFDGGNTPAGDLGGTWASPSVTDDSHAHTGTTLSSIDISADTNLSADGTEIVLTGDALSLGQDLTFTNGTATTMSVTNASTSMASTTSLTLHRNFTFNGVTGSTWASFCNSITGGSDLCDGVDNTAAGGSGLSTSTNIADTEIIFGTSPSTVGSEAAFTYDDATNILTVSGTGIFTSASSTSASTTGLTSTNSYLSNIFTAGDSINDFTGTGLVMSGNSLTASLGTDITAAEIANGDHGFFSYSGGAASLDAGGLTSANLSSALTDETGTGNVVFSGTPNFTGTAQFNGLTVSSSSTLGYASSTSLTVSGQTYLGLASSTAISGTNLNFTNATGSTFAGFGLEDCDADTQSLSWDVTTSKFVCGDDDSGGVGGGSSNWLYQLGRLSPSTTVGIGVFSSSTIGNGTATGGLTIDGGATTSQISMGGDTLTDFVGFGMTNNTGLLGLLQTGAADGECLVYVAAGPTIDWASCGGAGGSKWTDGTNFTYLTNTTYDLALGSNATETAPFWWDVSATTSYIGNGGSGDSIITVGTTTPWTFGFDDTDDSFSIATGTSLGINYFLHAFSTTTVMSSTIGSYITDFDADTGVRMNFGGNEYDGSANLDQFTFHGRIKNDDWYNFTCPYAMSFTQITSDTRTATGIGGSCDGFEFDEDGTAYMDAYFGAGYTATQLGSITANDGAGFWVLSSNGGAGGMRFSTSTPSYEVTARIGSIVANSSTTSYYIGFSNETINAAGYETVPTQGCYFVASSTNQNWKAICQSASATTNTDTGVSTTTIAAGAGAWRTFRIDSDDDEARFYIKQPSGGFRLVANPTGSSVPTTTNMNAGIWFGRTTGTQAIQFQFMGVDYWWRKFVPNGT